MNDPVKSFTSYVDIDSSEFLCPCGGSITTDASEIQEWFRKHTPHTDGSVVASMSDSAAKVVSEDHPTVWKYTIKGTQS
jgi:hypothetical protein